MPPTRIPLPVELYDPATNETLFAFTVGSVEGRGTFWGSGGDAVNFRNFQFGFMGTGPDGKPLVSPGGDISSGGGGEPGSPRMPFGIAYDNGGITTVYDGRHNEILSLRGAAKKADNIARFKAPVRFYNGALVRQSDGSWKRL